MMFSTGGIISGGPSSLEGDNLDLTDLFFSYDSSSSNIKATTKKIKMRRRRSSGAIKKKKKKKGSICDRGYDGLLEKFVAEQKKYDELRRKTVSEHVSNIDTLRAERDDLAATLEWKQLHDDERLRQAEKTLTALLAQKGTSEQFVPREDSSDEPEDPSNELQGSSDNKRLLEERRAARRSTLRDFRAQCRADWNRLRDQQHRAEKELGALADKKATVTDLETRETRLKTQIATLIMNKERTFEEEKHAELLATDADARQKPLLQRRSTEADQEWASLAGLRDILGAKLFCVAEEEKSSEKINLKIASENQRKERLLSEGEEKSLESEVRRDASMLRWAVLELERRIDIETRQHNRIHAALEEQIAKRDDDLAELRTHATFLDTRSDWRTIIAHAATSSPKRRASELTFSFDAASASRARLAVVAEALERLEAEARAAKGDALVNIYERHDLLERELEVLERFLETYPTATPAEEKTSSPSPTLRRQESPSSAVIFDWMMWPTTMW